MTTNAMRLGVVASVLLCGAVVANMLLMQPAGRRGGGDMATAAKRGAADKGRAAVPASGETVAEPRKPVETAVAPDPERPVAAPKALAAARAAIAPPSAGGADTVRAIQRELTARGYEAGTADGQIGLVTRAAIMAYEHDRGLALSAEPTPELLKLILIDAGPANAAPPRRLAIEQSVQATQIIRTVQQSLLTLGYVPGRVDGRLSEDTVRAIRDFEIDQGMQESGRVSGTLLARLSRLASQGRMASGR